MNLSDGSGNGRALCFPDLAGGETVGWEAVAGEEVARREAAVASGDGRGGARAHASARFGGWGGGGPRRWQRR